MVNTNRDHNIRNNYFFCLNLISFSSNDNFEQGVMCFIIRYVLIRILLTNMCALCMLIVDETELTSQ